MEIIGDLNITKGIVTESGNYIINIPSGGSLTEEDCSGNILNTYGQTDDMTVSIPSPSSGRLSFILTVGTTIDNYIHIDPDVNTPIYLRGETTGDGKYVGIDSAVTGFAISFITIQVSASKFAWLAADNTGDWTLEA
jgi:hypothetical protein